MNPEAIAWRELGTPRDRCQPIERHHAYTDSHLEAICGRQFTSQHVFGTWTNQRTQKIPPWTQQEHAKLTFELRIEIGCPELRGSDATHRMTF